MTTIKSKKSVPTTRPMMSPGLTRSNLSSSFMEASTKLCLEGVTGLTVLWSNVLGLLVTGLSEGETIRKDQNFTRYNKPNWLLIYDVDTVVLSGHLLVLHVLSSFCKYSPSGHAQLYLLLFEETRHRWVQPTPSFFVHGLVPGK